MPRVEKQSASPVKRSVKTGSVMDRVLPVSQVDSGGLHVSFYGRGKTGKTRLISTFPKPVLILGGEDGTRSIRSVAGVYFLQIVLREAGTPKKSSYVFLDELPSYLDQLDDSKYQTVAVDTASALQDLVLASIMGLTELPAQKSWGMANREQYGQCSLQMKTLLRKVIDLTCNTVITAHERNFNEEGSSGDLLFPSIGSALSPSVAGWLNGACEYICQTFIRESVTEKEVKVGDKKVKTFTKGRAEYCLRVGPHPIYQTGFRLPPGYDLPDVIVDPTYDKILKIVQGG